MLALALLGCTEHVTGPPGVVPEPVVQALLVAAQPRQYLSVAWSTPADSPQSFDPHAVAADQVDLTLHLPDGNAVPFLPGDTEGVFVAAATAEPEQVYRLTGTIAGRVVEAETRLPAPLVIVEPAGDPIRLPRTGAAGGSFFEFSYRWSASGAEGYFTVFSGPLPDAGVGIRQATNASGTIPLVVDTALATLTVYAYEPWAAAHLAVVGRGPTAPHGNVQGALGFFGGATMTTRGIRWE